VIDGEAVVLRLDGMPDFNVLHSGSLSVIPARAKGLASRTVQEPVRLRALYGSSPPRWYKLRRPIARAATSTVMVM
jgi:hypothetical protein